ncbi:MAG: hypothetical protein RL385_2496 [Pseudomonadota bacterium]|jgi:hypothetical protein
MNTSRSLLGYALIATIAGSVSPAQADAYADHDRYDPRRLYGGVWLGFAGNAHADAAFGGDLDTTLGGQLGMDWVTHRFVSLGFETRIGASKWERMHDRSKLVDLDFKPRFRPLAIGPFELYVAVPVGMTIPRLADVGDTNLNGKVGWNIGVGVGANLFLTRRFALNVEPNWLYHHFKVDGPANDIALTQFSLMINGVIAL